MQGGGDNAAPSSAPPRRGQQAPPCAMVIFGTAGDLTRRLLMPAIYNLSKTGLLNENFALVGVDRSKRSIEAFRADLSEGVRNFVSDTGGEGGSGDPFDEKAWDFIAQRMHLVDGDLTKPETYQALGNKLTEVAQDHQTQGNVLFYMAVASALFGPIVEHLGSAGLTDESAGGWRRVIIEKPFGNDLPSARALNARVLRVLSEPQVYRMDHFLGKETVQNIMVLRFANAIFEPLWTRDHIDHVQITVAETVGVERRASFYEVTGALRDMVPNHVFQLLSLTAMEPPNSFAADAVRTEKTKVLEAVVPLKPEDVHHSVVRGQYITGNVLGHPVPGYRDSEGVAADSMTETYVAMRLGIDNWRWAGVPFYLRTGKRLNKRSTEIAIRFKKAPLALFRETPVEELDADWLVLRVQPDEGIRLRFNAKRPGPAMALESVAMDFKYKDYFKQAPAVGYETLIYDCLIGDATLFQRADQVEAAWGLVEPVLEGWAGTNPRHFPNYAAGSEGPSAANDLLARDGRSWRRIN